MYTLESNIVSNFVSNSNILKSWNENQKNINNSNFILHAGIVFEKKGKVMKKLTEAYQTVHMYRKFKYTNCFEYYNKLYQRNKLKDYFKRFPSEKYWNKRNIFLLIHNMYQGLTDLYDVKLLKKMNADELKQIIQNQSKFTNILCYIDKD
jgi:hypothetical protein